MRRVNRWHAPRWIRVWMLCAARGGDGVRSGVACGLGRLKRDLQNSHPAPRARKNKKFKKCFEWGLIPNRIFVTKQNSFGRAAPMNSLLQFLT
ncbi:MAG: hypothetical protein ABSG26_26595, partial [Bryobacteraceae bacterium]